MSLIRTCAVTTLSSGRKARREKQGMVFEEDDREIGAADAFDQPGPEFVAAPA